MQTQKIIFLEPYLDEKIWGGKKLKEFNFKLDNKNIGEALIVSALENKSSIILNDCVSEHNLLDFYNNHQEFFNNISGSYPILTKIIDANDNLSIQVHPDDAYALNKHNKLGKTECWYILDAKPNSHIIYGLNFQSISELKQAIKNNDIKKCLKYIPVKTGDVIFVPAGTVHAITSGLLIYELQQNSDITYRLYDYDRLENGKPRTLMIDDALNVIKFNQKDIKDSNIHLVDCQYFKLDKIELTNETKKIDILSAQWLEVTVIDGYGQVDGLNIQKGSVFLVHHNHIPTISGHLKLLVAYIIK